MREIAELIVRMAKDNPTWDISAPRADRSGPDDAPRGNDGKGVRQERLGGHTYMKAYTTTLPVAGTRTATVR